MPKTKPTPKRTYVPDSDFVKALLASSGPDEAAERLGMSPISVQARASRLRKAGVKLPKFARRAAEVDVDALNKLIAQLSR